MIILRHFIAVLFGVRLRCAEPHHTYSYSSYACHGYPMSGRGLGLPGRPVPACWVAVELLVVIHRAMDGVAMTLRDEASSSANESPLFSRDVNENV